MTQQSRNRSGNRSRRRLDLRTRIEVMRLAVRGRRHPDPAVSLSAYEWARDRLRTPAWQELGIVAAGWIVGLAVVSAGLLWLAKGTAIAGLLVVFAPGVLLGASLWTLYLRRRVAQVEQVNGRS